MGEEGGEASAKRDGTGPVDLGGPPHTAPAQAGKGTALEPHNPSHCQPKA